MRLRAMAVGLAAVVIGGAGAGAAAGAKAPPSPPVRTTIQRVKDDPNLTTFGSLIHVAGLEGALTGKKATSLTIFAPTNAAFERLPKPAIAWLSSPSGLPTLRRIIRAHVVVGSFPSVIIQMSVRTQAAKIEADRKAGRRVGGLPTLPTLGRVGWDEFTFSGTGMKDFVLNAQTETPAGIASAVNRAHVGAFDLCATYGCIHEIDRLLMEPITAKAVAAHA